MKTRFEKIPLGGEFTMNGEWNVRWMKDSPWTATNGRVSKLMMGFERVEVEKLPRADNFTGSIKELT